MAQFFIMEYGRSRNKVFDTLDEARKHAMAILTKEHMAYMKDWEYYDSHRNVPGVKIPSPPYSKAIGAIKGDTIQHLGAVMIKRDYNTDKIAFEWKGNTINPSGSLRKKTKKKAMPFGL